MDNWYIVAYSKSNQHNMIKNLLLIVAVFCSGNLIAQDTFNDNFEAFTAGDFVTSGADNWNTWNNSTGGAVDAQISSEQSSSGTNSLLMQGGGNSDIVLDFGGVRNSGMFIFSTKIYFPEGKGGYMNFQGTSTPGQSWTMNAAFGTNGSLIIDDAAVDQVVTTYRQNAWFEFGFEINLDANQWRVLIDGECVGVFFNTTTNAVASLNLYPRDNNDQFYIDDIIYTWEEEAPIVTPSAIDAAISLDASNALSFSGAQLPITGTLINFGTEVINEVQLAYTIGEEEYTQTLGDLDLLTGSYDFTLDNTVTLSDGIIPVVVRVITVNGGMDENDCNDKGALNFTGFEAHPDKNVFVEEGTGTWCPWCPRGDVFMNRMADKYGDRFVGIAVHNGQNDPMVVSDWDSGIGPFPGFTGYPGVIFERSNVIDPSGLEASVILGLQEAPISLMTHEAIYDASTRALEITIVTNFMSDATGDYTLVVGMTEDGVMGTSAAYNQANNYAGQGPDAMGDYGILPNPVPAAQMVYNHTARALLTPFGGLENAFGTGQVTSGVYEHTFTYTVPEAYDLEKMHIVSAVISNTGADNAKTSKVSTFVDTYDPSLESAISIFPNPTDGLTQVLVQLDQSSDVTIQLVDAVGTLLSSRLYQNMNGENIYPIDAANLASGVYYVRISTKDKFATKKMIVAK